MTDEEFEVTYLDIDTDAIEQKLRGLGAKHVASFDYSITNYDYPGFTLGRDKNAWVKIRTDGTETTLSYKQRLGVKDNSVETSDEGMKEIEVVVSDYDDTRRIFEEIGLIRKNEQEKKRVRYEKNGIQFDIDQWPKIPKYLEIEADSWSKVDEGIALLGLNPKDKKICSAFEVLKHYGYDAYEYPVFTFSEQKKAEDIK